MIKKMSNALNDFYNLLYEVEYSKIYLMKDT
jgi:hypothetical protein